VIDVIGVVFFSSLGYGGFFDLANAMNLFNCLASNLPLRCGTLFISLTIKITNKRNFNNASFPSLLPPVSKGMSMEKS